MAKYRILKTTNAKRQLMQHGRLVTSSGLYEKVFIVQKKMLFWWRIVNWAYYPELAEEWILRDKGETPEQLRLKEILKQEPGVVATYD